MDLEQAQATVDPDAAALLAALPPYHEADALALAERLRRSGTAPAVASAVLTQARLRARVHDRLTPWGDHLLLTPEGAEQATRPVVARHRAARFAAAGVDSVVDLSCGLGVDALALAEAGISVQAVEADPATALLAAANAAALGHASRLTVTTGRAEDQVLHADDVAFVDPARRRGGRRVQDPAAWSPPLPWVLALPCRTLAAKVAPGLSEAAVPDDCERELVSVSGAVVEAALYRGALRTTRVRATLLPRGATLTESDLPPGAAPVRQVGRFVLEPDGAVIRAGLVAAVATQVDGGLVDARLAYVTTDSDVRTPFARRFEVVDVVPFQLKRLRTRLRALDAGPLEVKTRGSAVDPDELRKRLSLHGGTPFTVLVTRLADRPVALVTRTVDDGTD